MLDLADAIERACLIEATARKAGNVHPGASFHDLNWEDFATAAHALKIAWQSETTSPRVGTLILKGVTACRAASRSNANLGIVLLLAPLWAAPSSIKLTDAVPRILAETTVDDTAFVYEAIRLANPGGLGTAAKEDVASAPTVTLTQAMQLAANRDQIASEYANNFQTVLVDGPRLLLKWTHRFSKQAAFPSLGWHRLPVRGLPVCEAQEASSENLWELAICGLQLDLLAAHGDSLIARKLGRAISKEAAERAQSVLQHEWPFSEKSWDAWHNFDAWLRADGHRRNPGTTADFIAAIVFAAIRDHGWQPPSKAALLDSAEKIRQAEHPTDS